MTRQDARRAVVAYWTEKATEALASAEAELEAGRLSFAVNRAYYACFYALSSVLLHEDLRFVKHSGVRAALHRGLVKTGRLEARWGRFYDRLFENRQRGDYQELVTFDVEQVAEIVEEAKGFLTAMDQLMGER
ncbi:MAG: HEPN domain-containing protein [Deferrisomatales bacterium]